MAFTETREGKRGTSHRVIWSFQKQRCTETFSTLAGAEQWVKILDQVRGDPTTVDRVLARSASSAPKLSEIPESYLKPLLDVAKHTPTKCRTCMRSHPQPLDIPVDTITEDEIARWVD